MLVDGKSTDEEGCGAILVQEDFRLADCYDFELC